MAVSNRPQTRPLSPHLQVWRWHITMATSILHRASGMALAFGALVLVAWLWALMGGQAWHGMFAEVFGSAPGKVIAYLWGVALAFHMASGLRHLVWDAGAGFSPRISNTWSWLMILWAFAAPLAVFLAAGVIP